VIQDFKQQMSTLSQLQTELQAVAGPIRTATVSLGRDGRGTGVVIAEGVVLTNAHILNDRTISVRFADGRTAQAQVTAVDVDGDLAVLAADTAEATPLEWSETAGETGSLVLAGHGNGTVSMGMVSAVGLRFRGPRGRFVSDTVEHTAPLSRGASGGPLVNIDGRLIGINTARSDAGYRAVSVSADLRSRVNRLMAGEHVERPVLGIAVVPSVAAKKVRKAAGLAERDGVLIQGVADGSAAMHAGLAQGDLIVGAASKPVTDIEDINRALDLSPATLELQVIRGSDERTVTVTFSQTPSSAESA
jgi:serine protease Do